MAATNFHPAKAILLAVELSIKADLVSLRNLVAQNSKALRTEIILRILLSYLPESLESSAYVPFLLDLASGKIWTDSHSSVDTSSLQDISDEAATKKARKLHLLPLAWPDAPPDAPDDHLLLFLIHRAYRIDEETGLIPQLPELLEPFLNQSQYLRSWMISSLLPLLRFNYEYHPQEGAIKTIKEFESLDDRAGVDFLLSNTGTDLQSREDPQNAVGRDLKGLIGPWMYGDTRSKRRKTRHNFNFDAQTVSPLDEPDVSTEPKSAGWEVVFQWVTVQASASWSTCVEAIEQWDGPGDYDLGGYEAGTTWLQEEEQRYLEARYARAALASAYLIVEPSEEALAGVQRILVKLVRLMDFDRIPTLQAAAALLSPIPSFDGGSIAHAKNATCLRTGLMNAQNPLTTPNEISVIFLHGLLISSFILTRRGSPCSIRRAGELVLLQDTKEQEREARKLLSNIADGPKGDDKFWVRTRHEILWLRDWGVEELVDGTLSGGGGIFGMLRRDFLEKEILKVLLTNTRYSLARSIYETSQQRTLSRKKIQDVVYATSMNAYDNATNPNRTRGGMKKCDEILQALPEMVEDSLAISRAKVLVRLTHSIGQYRLVLKQGEPFTPVVLRVHHDPLSIVGKILHQNPKVFTRIHELVDIGEDMVRAGLTLPEKAENQSLSGLEEDAQISIAKKRITSMCIDAALSEDDFETAYSYVMNRLNTIAESAQARSPTSENKSLFLSTASGIAAHPPPTVIDDWSWRAALQAGKYRYNSNTIRPTHLGNSVANLDIRHLQQRMECLSLALRIAPPSTLQGILNVYRRCEEELDTKIADEADQEDAWDEQGDQTVMPGGFGTDPAPKPSRATAAASRGAEEAPMSIFDLTRASAAQAQRSLSSITSMAARDSRGTNDSSSKSTDEVAHDVEERVRKRDQLRNAAVGTLASGIGWLINAPPVSERPAEK